MLLSRILRQFYNKLEKLYWRYNFLYLNFVTKFIIIIKNYNYAIIRFYRKFCNEIYNKFKNNNHDIVRLCRRICDNFIINLRNYINDIISLCVDFVTKFIINSLYCFVCSIYIVILSSFCNIVLNFFKFLFCLLWFIL